ncbi:MAG TPA: metallophosphoesterase, partial [Chitinophagaceae bacterium]|nr:metallophosphoesterase [Chitinophagaceae bacterium]
NVDIDFYITQPDSLKKSYSGHLLNFSRIPEEKVDSAKKQTPVNDAVTRNTVTVPASRRYGYASGFQRLILGNNYRKEWATPVNMKVFHITTEKGGFKITGMGGGKQTKSLKLEDKEGREWTLRTIDKDPEKAIPENFRNTFAEDVVQDMISAAHPYAPLAIPDLAKAAHVVVPTPEVFFVPDDPALGFYQKMFANTVCLLEERDPTPDNTEGKSTAKLLRDLVNDNDHVVQQDAVLKARLLDMLIGDWDRHFDQWKWGETDTGKGKLYYPIPRDRDQAFFNSDGLLLWYASQNQLPFLKGFRKNIYRPGWFNYSARDFDRVFLNKLGATQWQSIIKDFQTELTDQVIETAVSKLPPEVYSFSGKQIVSKLKSRRDQMMKKGMRYYKFLSDYVNIVGTNEREYFHVSSVDSGLRVVVYGRNDKVDTGFKMFDRTFKKGVTDELRLYGLNGNDLFYVDPDALSHIKLRIVGGKGSDTFDIRGNVKSLLYDMKDSVNYLINSHDAKVQFSKDPSVNDFDWVEFQYNQYRYPKFTAGYNPEDGLLVGAGFSRK